MAELSDEAKWNIVAAMKRTGSVPAAVRITGQRARVVPRWWERYQATGKVEKARKSGRRPALSAAAARKAAELLMDPSSRGADHVATQLAAARLTSSKVHKSTLSGMPDWRLSCRANPYVSGGASHPRARQRQPRQRGCSLHWPTKGGLGATWCSQTERSFFFSFLAPR